MAEVAAAAAEFASQAPTVGIRLIISRGSWLLEPFVLLAELMY